MGCFFYGSLHVCIYNGPCPFLQGAEGRGEFLLYRRGRGALFFADMEEKTHQIALAFTEQVRIRYNTYITEKDDLFLLQNGCRAGPPQWLPVCLDSAVPFTQKISFSTQGRSIYD